VASQQRDKEVDYELRSLGWTVLRVWEHETRTDLPRILRLVARLDR